MFRALIFLMFCIPLLANAHGGRTNSSGCHNNRKTGGYHCHGSRAPVVKRFLGSSKKVGRLVYFNTKSLKYHSPNCRWAKACTVNCISTGLNTALKRGGAACKVCGGR